MVNRKGPHINGTDIENGIICAIRNYLWLIPTDDLHAACNDMGDRTINITDEVDHELRSRANLVPGKPRGG